MCASPGNITVGQASTKLVDTNEKRVGLFVRNLSVNNVSIGFNHAAEVNKGYVLFPNECYSMTPDDFSTSEIYVIATGDNSLISYQEFSCREAI